MGASIYQKERKIKYKSSFDTYLLFSKVEEKKFSLNEERAKKQATYFSININSIYLGRGSVCFSDSCVFSLYKYFYKYLEIRFDNKKCSMHVYQVHIVLWSKHLLRYFWASIQLSSGHIEEAFGSNDTYAISLH